MIEKLIDEFIEFFRTRISYWIWDLDSQTSTRIRINSINSEDEKIGKVRLKS